MGLSTVILLILLFAGLMLVAGVSMLVKPDMVFGLLESNLDRPVIYIIAIVVRLLIGAALILQSRFSNFPIAIQLLGWLFVAAAILLTVIGRQRFVKLVKGVFARFRPYGRFGGGLAVAFGGFLILSYV